MFTRNVRVTGFAALYNVSPGWVAVIEHVPGATSVICMPSTVHTARALEVKVTGRPELAVAEAVTGDWTSVLFEIAVKVIDWVARLTAKVRVTGFAGRQSALPGWLAVTLHVPGSKR